MTFMRTSGLIGKDGVRTTSWLRMWWLTKIKGFQISNMMEHPTRYSFGKLVFQRVWILKPPSL
jgi:hypothetical protein